MVNNLKKIFQTTWEDFFLFKIYDFQETGGDENDGIYVPESKKETPWEQGVGDGWRVVRAETKENDDTCMKCHHEAQDSVC